MQDSFPPPVAPQKLSVSAWRNRLVAGGLVLAWLASLLGLASFLPMQGASWLVFFAIAITPGYLLGDIVAWRLDLDWLERLALAFPLSLVVLAPAGLAAMLLHWTVQEMVTAWTITTGLVILLWLVPGHRVRRSYSPRRMTWALDEIAMLVLLALALIYIYPSLTLFKIDGDLYTYLAFAREALSGRPMNLTEPLFGTDLPVGIRMGFNQFLPLTILRSYLSGVDLVPMAAQASNVMIAVWAVLASYMLGKAAGQGSRRTGLFTALIQMLIYLSAPFVRGDNVSVWFLDHAGTDKFAVATAMLPVGFALCLRFVREGRRDAWVAAALVALAVSTIHALVAAMLALGVAAFGAVYLLLHLRDRVARGRAIGLAALTLVVMLLPLTQLAIVRIGDRMAPTFPNSLNGWTIGEKMSPVLPFVTVPSLDRYGPLPDLGQLEPADATTSANPFLIWRFVSNMQQRRIVLFGLDSYIVDPSYIWEPVFVLALVMLLVLIPGWRRNVAAQFCIGVSAAVSMVMFNPFLTPLLGSLVVPWLLWRFVWLLPYALIIALGLERLVMASAGVVSRFPRLHLSPQAVRAVAPLTLIIVVGLLARQSIVNNLAEDYGRAIAGDIYPAPAQLIQRLAAETDRDGPVTVVADQRLSVPIPAYMPNAKIVAQRTLSTSEIFPADQQDVALERLIDQNKLFNSKYLTVDAIATLRRYKARYVITSSGDDLDTQLRLAPQWFTWLMDDQSYSLYRVSLLPLLSTSTASNVPMPSRAYPVDAISIDGNTAMDRQQWETAFQLYQSALRENPKDALALVGLAEYYQRQNQFALAEGSLRRALAENDVPALHYRLGLLYAQLGQLDASLRELDQAQRMAPQVSRYHIAFGDACLNAFRRECAFEQYKLGISSLALADESSRQAALANLWQERYRPEQAIPYLESAIAISPSTRNRLSLLAAYENQRAFDQAETLLQSLERNNPLAIRLVSARAGLASAQGNYARAESYYQQALWAQGLFVRETAGTHLALAQMYVDAKNWLAAETHVETALNLEPNSPRAYLTRGHIYNKQGLPDKAIAAYRRAIAIDPTQVVTYEALSDQFRESAAPPDDTLTLLYAATRRNSDSASLFLSLGDQLVRRGSVQEAILNYQIALDLADPQDATGRSRQQPAEHLEAVANARLAAIFEDQGQIQVAMTYYQGALAAAPAESWTRVLLGDALRRRGQMTEAETAYRDAIRMNPNYVDSYLRLGDLLKTIKGDSFSAFDLYQEALTVATRQANSRQEAKADLSLGAFYFQSRQPSFAMGSEDIALYLPANPPDQDTQNALSVYNQGLAAEADLAAISGLAQLYQETGQPDQAIAVLQNEIAKKEAEQKGASILASLYRSLGDLYLTLHRLDDAGASYRRAAALNPWSAAPRLGLGRTLLELNDKTGALAEFRAAVELAPGSIDAQLALAKILDQQGEKQQALAIMQSMVQAHPGNVAALLELGDALKARMLTDQAEQSYRNALAVVPSSAEAHIAIARLAQARGLYANAETELQQAIRLDRQNRFKSYTEYARLMARQSRYPESMETYQKALQVDPNDWRNYAGLARLNELLGRADQAIENYKKATAIDITRVEPLIGLANLYQEQNQYDRAEQALLIAMNRSPQSLTTRFALAELYSRAGQGDKALAQLKQIVEFNPRAMESLARYASELLNQNRLAEAAQYYQLAEEASEPSTPGYRELARARLVVGQFDQALALIDQAVALEPAEADNWVLKSQVYSQKGDQPSALASLRKASEIGPSEGAVWQAMANYYVLALEPRQAIPYLEKAIAVDPTYLPSYGALLEIYRDLSQNDQMRNTAAAAEQAVPGSFWSDIYRARYLEQIHDWDKARSSLEQAVAKAPGVPASLFARGELELLLGRGEEALKWNVQAASRRPGDSASQARLIELMLKRGRNAEAREQVLKVLEGQAGNSALIASLGVVQRTMGEYDAAESSLLKAAKGNAIDSKILEQLAILYAAEGKLGDAVSAYERAIAINPRIESYYLDVSAIWERLGKPKRALDVLTQAAARVAHPSILYAAASRIHLRQGDPAAALVVLNDAVRAHGEDVDLLIGLGNYYATRAEFDRAEQYFRRAAAVNGDESAGYKALGDFYLERGNIERAVTNYQSAIAAEPADAGAVLALARAYRISGKFSAAASAYSQVLDLEPTQVDAYIALAEVYENQALADDAQRVYVQGTGIVPTSGPLLTRQGLFLLGRGEERSALERLDQAARLADGADTRVARASLYRISGRSAEAKRELQEATRIEAGSVRAWNALGELYQSDGRVDSAHHAFTQLVDVAPGRAVGYVRLAQLARVRGQIDEALRQLDAGRQAEPTSADVLLEMAELHRVQGQWSAADKDYQQTIAVSPVTAAAYIQLSSLVLQYTGDFDRAKAWLEQAQNLGLEPAVVSVAFGSAYTRVARSNMAGDLYEQAIRAEPGSEAGYLAMSRLYLAMGLAEQAVDYARRAIQVHPNCPGCYIQLGRIYQNTGDAVSAELNYRQASQLDARRGDAYVSLANLYTSQKKYPDALDAIRRAMTRNPLDWSLWIDLGNVYVEMGESGYAQALSAFDTAAAMNPSVPDPWLRRGDIALYSKYASSALAAYNQARSLRPNSALPLVRMAEVYDRLDDHSELDRTSRTKLVSNLKKAEELARQAIELEPNSGASYVVLAKALLDQGREVEGIASLYMAMKRAPHLTVAFDVWAHAHIEKGSKYYNEEPLADVLYRLAAAADGNSLWAKMALAHGYFVLEGGTPRTIQLLEEAVTADPACSELYRDLGSAYEQAFDLPRAIGMWSRYLTATSYSQDNTDIRAHLDWLRGAWIDSPTNGAQLSGEITISGTANRQGGNWIGGSKMGFQFYKLEFESVDVPSGWVNIGDRVYNVPVERGLLATWNTTGLTPGRYRLRLTVVDSSGNYGPYHEIVVSVR